MYLLLTFLTAQAKLITGAQMYVQLKFARRQNFAKFAQINQGLADKPGVQYADITQEINIH